MKWKFEELTTEQKQIIVLCILLSFGISYAVYRFALVPSLKAMGKARDELGELETQLRTARRMIMHRAEIVQQLQESGERLRQWVKAYVAPRENALAWATEYIYRQARQVGIDVESASETAVGLVPWQSSPETRRIFDPYVIRILFRTDFFRLVEFLDRVEKTNPFVIVGQITITANRTEPEHHNVEVRLIFPTWSEGHGPQDIRSPPEGLLKQIGAAPAGVGERRTPGRGK